MMLKVVSNFVNSIGALNYKGTWNATTNVNPTLASGVGTKGDYYVVSVAGSTNLDGVTLWGVGDWAVFNGTIWQKVDGGDTGNFTSVTVTGLTASKPVFTDANKVLTSTGTLGADQGGTGQSSYTAGDTLYASGSTALSKLAIGAANSVMTSSGSAPQWSTSLTLTGVTTTTGSTFATSSGNVAVGTATPAAKFDVVGAYQSGAPSTSSVIFNRINNGGAISLWTGGTAYSYMWMQSIQDDGSNNLKSIVLNPLGGSVGIGTGNPGYTFEVAVDSAAKPTTNTWTIASDARIKSVTGEYQKGLNEICALRPITYRYNGKAGFVDDGKENVSIIAQEAVNVFPECVGSFMRKLEESDAEETELLNWNGHAVTFALINAVKELKAQIDILQSELASLKAGA